MTSKDNGQDQELLDRYRRASETDPVAPSDAVRSAILAEGRRVAGQLAAQGAPRPFEVSRRAANDSRWRITAFGTAAAALLAGLLIAPRYWESLPPPSVESRSARSDADGRARIAGESAPLAAAPPAAAGPAPEHESVAPGAMTPEKKTLRPVPNYAAAPKPQVLQPAPAPSISPAENTQSLAASLSQRATSADRAVQGAASANAGASTRGRQTNALMPAALQAAAAVGDVDEATLLLNQGAAVDRRDAQGRTPLLVAVEQNRAAVVRLLLTRGADPNAVDDAGHTPLQQAKNKDFQEIAAMLEGAGAH